MHKYIQEFFVYQTLFLVQKQAVVAVNSIMVFDSVAALMHLLLWLVALALALLVVLALALLVAPMELEFQL
jgi:hypothetical protein